MKLELKVLSTYWIILNWPRGNGKELLISKWTCVTFPVCGAGGNRSFYQSLTGFELDFSLLQLQLNCEIAQYQVQRGSKTFITLNKYQVAAAV